MGASTEQYRRRKAAGLCVECGKPLDRVGAYCIECCRAHSEDSKQQKRWYADGGVCPVCKTNKLMGTERCCPECRAKSTEYASRKRNTNRDLYNKQHAEWAKIQYAERVEKGLCTRCGKRPAKDGAHTCVYCAEKTNAYHRRKRAEKRLNAQERYEKGICRFCNNPVKDGYKLCEHHYQLNLINSAKADRSAYNRRQYQISQRRRAANNNEERQSV
nr:MAG TPA: Thaumarchaeal output domain 1 [Caudoviricetes sp.]